MTDNTSEEIQQTLYAVAYARVSTDDKNQDPETQLFGIRKWAKAKGNIKILAEFRDESTGTNMNRRGLSDLFGYLTMNSLNPDPGKVSIMLALDNSRVARNQKDMPKILDVLEKAGVRLIFIANEQLDLSTTQGYLINSIDSFGSQKYTDDHGARVKIGQEKARAKGTHIGRPSKRGDDFIDVDLLIEFAKKGYSLRRLEKVYKCSRNTLKRRMQDDGRYEEFVEASKNASTHN